MSESNVRPIVEKRREPIQDVIDACETLLAEAKAGKLRGFTIVVKHFGEYESHDTGAPELGFYYQARCHGDIEKSEVLLSVEYMKHDLLFSEKRK